MLEGKKVWSRIEVDIVDMESETEWVVLKIYGHDKKKCYRNDIFASNKFYCIRQVQSSLDE